MVFRYLGHMYEHLWSREDGEEVAIKAAAKLVITAATTELQERIQESQEAHAIKFLIAHVKQISLCQESTFSWFIMN